MVLKGNVVAVDVKEGNGKVAKVNNRVSVLDKLSNVKFSHLF